MRVWLHLWQDGVSSQGTCERSGARAGRGQVQLVSVLSIPSTANGRRSPALDSTQPYSAFHPVIDNTLFTEYTTVSILKGNFADVPIIVG